ncbi:MAG: Porphobilinogen deaminase [Cyanobacteria bacterium RYN_339]|nr:Porphobilinogen deaminase [Cyanobacteria bacterium RYN_339]
MNRTVTVGTRGSQLALWQADHVSAALVAAVPGLVLGREIIKTQGDKILDVPLSRIGDRGLFVKEIEEALLAGRIDLAVHSLKDLPTAQPEKLAIACVMARVDARDCLVSPQYASMADLPANAVVGTSSLRRKAQLKAHYPGWQFKDVRGNLQTRLDKLDRGEYDALILACAGLDRLGLGDRIAERIPFHICLPAVGQGALAIETRDDDAELMAWLVPLEDAATRACITAERALLSKLEGGCQVPIGAQGRVDGDVLHLEGVVASLDGERVLRASAEGPVAEAVEIGRRVAAELLRQGGDAILASIRAEADVASA